MDDWEVDESVFENGVTAGLGGIYDAASCVGHTDSEGNVFYAISSDLPPPKPSTTTATTPAPVRSIRI
jgi:hypothetical protein